MNKNWYIVYTKPQFEKRVVASLNKKKVGNYFPLTQVTNKGTGRDSIEPLFLTMIFTKVTSKELADIKKIEGVLSIMHFKDKPATINEGEINAIKDFTMKYQDIKVMPSLVDLLDEVRNISTPIKSVDGKVHSISYKTIRLNLPSLGFLLTAEVNIIPSLATREIDFKSKLLPHY